MVGSKRILNREHLRGLIAEQEVQFYDRTANSRALFEESSKVLLGGVPMSWMNKWIGGYPVFFKSATANRIFDVDSREYIDFCLGDTGAMAGHSPLSTVSAITQRIGLLGGITTMLPSADSVLVGKNLSERFGLDLWQFTLSATDANRFVVRLARQITGRGKVMVFSYCYHGTVDETFVVLEDGVTRSRAGNVGPSVDPSSTTVAVEFNDLDGVKKALATGEIACILMEPAMTNIGIVLPEDGFVKSVIEAAHEVGSLVVIDETHTFSAGWGGCTREWDLHPDFLTIGKSLGGGVPFGAFGITTEVAERINSQTGVDYVDTGGIGGTLAGNALSLAAARATLLEVFTKETQEAMNALSAQFASGVQRVIDGADLPWTISTLGARSEYRFTPVLPVSGGESAASADEDLDTYMHLFMANRGILMTPFHNMALMSPKTTLEDVLFHGQVFEEAVSAIAWI
ncbi:MULTISPECIES: transaminase [Acidithrix]|uniref:Glutamate-1-semialdehyde 2,1-aminomutase 1 n=1 Tax=Acidithrix ferrooxidans TaxID=1280514 RepID=A0A0D8HE94_9ACTN|nr:MULTISPECIES: transaminase [Acidithrix]KJF16117.1 glutamate-1-semialdehyde 2,1-aminomutase 1 [Acidithrix ferrooxidans]CAG4914379.1 unnamed protein product [Acidithrix sp. C25]